MPVTEYQFADTNGTKRSHCHYVNGSTTENVLSEESAGDTINVFDAKPISRITMIHT